MAIRESWFRLEPDEKTLLIIKHHWLIIVRRLFELLLLALLPFALLLAVQGLDLERLFLDSVARALVVLGLSLYYLFLVAVGLYHWVDHYLDLWIITNHRIIDVNQNGLFSRVVAQYRLERIQDATAEVSGFWHTVFNFGTVKIETAGADSNLHMEQIPHPREVVHQIHKLSMERRTAVGGE